MKIIHFQNAGGLLGATLLTIYATTHLHTIVGVIDLWLAFAIYIMVAKNTESENL